MQWHSSFRTNEFHRSCQDSLQPTFLEGGIQGLVHPRICTCTIIEASRGLLMCDPRDGFPTILAVEDALGIPRCHFLPFLPLQLTSICPMRTVLSKTPHVNWACCLNLPPAVDRLSDTCKLTFGVCLQQLLQLHWSKSLRCYCK